MFFASQYFDNDEFMHHALHEMDASGAGSSMCDKTSEYGEQV